MSEYSEKLKDPRWQKLRLKVFERDGFKCCCCDARDATLHVHHLIYSQGEPWDAPPDTLETLCESCHEFREDFNQFVKDVFGQKRSLAPTLLCWSLLRFCDPQCHKSKQDPTVLGNRFANYWRYVGPERLGDKAVEADLKKINGDHAGCDRIAAEGLDELKG